jgi:hypothetical protein
MSVKGLKASKNRTVKLAENEELYEGIDFDIRA